jgi:transposase
MLLRTVDVERLISDDHPARAVWEFVGRLDLSGYVDKIRSREGRAGRPALDPRVMISLWVYSYSVGVSSAREIERRCEHDPAYQWLTGMESISAHALSDFRSDHPATLQDLFAQVLGVLKAEGLITFARVMQDGTKVRAHAASSEFRTESRIQEHLDEARSVIAALDASGDEELSRQAQRARERVARERQQKLEAALVQWEELKKSKSTVERVSTTDPEARVMKLAEGGSAPSYNLQICTDATHGLIVDVAITQSGADYRQLTPAMDRLEQKAGQPPAQVVVDGGYISTENIVAMSNRGIELIGPEPRTKAADANKAKSYEYRGVHADYYAERFSFDETNRCYVCPQGKRLTYDAKYPSKGTIHVRYKASAAECNACPVKHLCCPRTRTGRSIEESESVTEVASFRARMQTPESRAIYRTRSPIAEFPNLWIKAKFGIRQFRLVGRAKVQLEALWAAITYDIQHSIRLRRCAATIG